jgi:hypothetical protein
MDQQTQEFELRFRSKLAIFFLFTLVGGPMLYAAYLNYQVEEVLFAVLMVMLFLAWAVVILMAIGFKIKLTDSSIHREGLISPSIIEFSDVDAIHFGSTWSNFYIESDDQKIYFGKDFENYENILHTIVDKVSKTKDIDNVRFLGDDGNIETFTGSKSLSKSSE